MFNRQSINTASTGLILICLLLTGCSAENIQPYSEQNKTLEPGNGWLALAVFSPNDSLQMELDSGGDGYLSPEFPFGNSFSLVQLPAGDYYVGGLRIDSVRFRFEKQQYKETYGFTIRPDVINYFGNIKLVGNQLELKVFMDDVRKITAGYYPTLVEQFPVEYTGNLTDE